MLCMALATPNGRTFSRSGFVQFSNYCLPSNFPDLEKDWKMEIKSGQMVKRIEFFFFFKATTSALEVNFCFSFWSNLIQSRPFVCSVPEKSFVSSFLRSLLITYLITLSLKKEIIVLEKSLENVLDFGSKNLHEPW